VLRRRRKQIKNKGASDLWLKIGRLFFVMKRRGLRLMPKKNVERSRNDVGWRLKLSCQKAKGRRMRIAKGKKLGTEEGGGKELECLTILETSSKNKV